MSWRQPARAKAARRRANVAQALLPAILPAVSRLVSTQYCSLRDISVSHPVGQASACGPDFSPPAAGVVSFAGGPGLSPAQAEACPTTQSEQYFSAGRLSSTEDFAQDLWGSQSWPGSPLGRAFRRLTRAFEERS